MALIKCPECGKKVSDKANVCIHCGYPLEETELHESRISEIMEEMDNLSKKIEKDEKYSLPYLGYWSII